MPGFRVEVLCARCKTSMEYVSEVERGNEVRISRFYRCPACGFRVLDEMVIVRSSSEGVLVEVSRVQGRRLDVVRVVG